MKKLMNKENIMKKLLIIIKMIKIIVLKLKRIG
jgi:hypothetical protein